MLSITSETVISRLHFFTRNERMLCLFNKELSVLAERSDRRIGHLWVKILLLTFYQLNSFYKL